MGRRVRYFNMTESEQYEFNQLIEIVANISNKSISYNAIINDSWIVERDDTVLWALRRIRKLMEC